MNLVLVGLLCVVVVLLLAEGMGRSGRVVEFPFLAGAAFFAFILPQLPGLAEDPYLPDGAFARAMIVTIGCALACRVGWGMGWTVTPEAAVFSERRLLFAAAVLSACGAFFFFQFNRLPYEYRTEGLHTGISVAYLFLGKLLYYGFTIAVLCLARRVTPAALAIVLFDSVFYLDRIVISGRRSDAVQFAVAIAVALWFQRRWAVPRTLALVGLAVGALLLASTGDYRQRTMSRDGPAWNRLADIAVLDNFQKGLADGGQEMRNAILLMERVSRAGNHDLAAYHWNTLVFNYVPAQIVGTRIKRSLLIDLPESRERDYSAPTGTTETGMADAYASFGYAGPVKFLLIGLLMGALYRGAMAGRTEHQVFYALLVVPAMLTITHHTHWLLSEAVQAVLFVGPFLLFARIGRAPLPGGRHALMAAEPGMHRAAGS